VISVQRGSAAREPASDRRVLAISLLLALIVVGSVALGAVGFSLAVFTSQVEGEAVFGAKAQFPGERVTPAFVIGDASSGSEIDRTSPYALAADGLTTTTSAWSSAFAADRYLEFELNDPLASGVTVTAATFELALASSGPGQACVYLEVRRISSGALQATHGSAGSPLGCVTGTTPGTISTGIGSVTTTNLANDLRIRVFGAESGSAPMVIDMATVGGATPYQVFTLFPVLVRDAADTTVDTVAWGLALP
jgi:hypothetical protein